MLFGLNIWVGPWNYVTILRGAVAAHCKVYEPSALNCAKTVAWLWSRIRQRIHGLKKVVEVRGEVREKRSYRAEFHKHKSFAYDGQRYL